MNIKLTNYEFAHKRRLKPEISSEHPNSLMCNSVGLCKENKTRGYNVNFSGSAPKKSEAAAKSLLDKVFKTNAFKWLAGFAGDHNVAASALIALFLAGALRPAVTISLPGKKDTEDKIYAAGHSMASGIIGFAFSTLITTPIDSGIKYIFNDAKKMSKADYKKLSVEELADYIRKYNITAEDIANKMETPDKSKEMILKDLKIRSLRNFLRLSDKPKYKNSEKIAKYVKNNHGVIIPVRKIKKGLTIVSDKVDEINKLKHELFIEKKALEKASIPRKLRKLENKFRKAFGLSEKNLPPLKLSPKANDLAKLIRELSNHSEGINATMHNISEWVIAIPRAMLTIALIPPILKYVFHIEKKNKEAANKQPKTQMVNSNFKNTKVKQKSLNEFVGGAK